jgi:hypothetical protein
MGRGSPRRNSATVLLLYFFLWCSDSAFSCPVHPVIPVEMFVVLLRHSRAVLPLAVFEIVKVRMTAAA